MSRGARVGLLGGTFDPVHLGHLSAARAAADALSLDEVRFIPSSLPPHRPGPPGASPCHRFAMVALAVAADARFVADDVEMQRSGPSYTADTLARLHAAGLAPWQLFFIIGTDAFAEIETWRDYPAVLDLAQFVVVSRPGQPLGALAARLPALAKRMIPVEAIPGRSAAPTASILLVPAPTPDVSSTLIRDRSGQGVSLAGLVPPEVEHHIRRHRLYQRGLLLA